MDLNALINSDDATDSLKRKTPDVLEASCSHLGGQHQEPLPPPQKVAKSSSNSNSSSIGIGSSAENEDSEYEYEEEQGTIDEMDGAAGGVGIIMDVHAQQITQPHITTNTDKKPLLVTLAFGRLASRVRLFPDPTPIVKHEKCVDPGFPAGEFPRCLGIAGFLSARTLPSPPSISAHRVLPLPLPLQPQLQLPSPTKNNGPAQDNETHNNASDDDDEGLFAAMLSSALFTQRLTAVVALGPEWRGMITAPALGKLVLHVLKPKIVLPGLGPLHALTALSSLMLAGHTGLREPEIPVDTAAPARKGKANGPDSAASEEGHIRKVPFQRLPLFPERNAICASFAQFERLTYSLPGSYDELSEIFDRVVAMTKSFHKGANMLGLFYKFVQRCYSNAEARKQQGISLFKELCDKTKQPKKSQTQKV